MCRRDSDGGACTFSAETRSVFWALAPHLLGVSALDGDATHLSSKRGIFDKAGDILVAGAGQRLEARDWSLEPQAGPQRLATRASGLKPAHSGSRLKPCASSRPTAARDSIREPPAGPQWRATRATLAALGSAEHCFQLQRPRSTITIYSLRR